MHEISWSNYARSSFVDEDVAKFCETHNVLDVKTYEEHDWEKEVVIQYR